MSTIARPLHAAAIAAAVLLLSVGLTACGEYAPIESDADDQSQTENPAPPDEDDDTDASSPADPRETAPDAISPPAQDEAEPPLGDTNPIPDIDRRPTPRNPSSGSGGTGGSSGGTGGSSGTGGTGGSTGGTGGGTVSYTWGLPPSDTSVTGNDGPAYGMLRQDCQSAINFLSSTVDLFFWGFNTPRYTVMYVAGLAHCLGRSDLGNAYFSGAITAYGDAGLDRIDFDPVTADPLDPQPEPLGYGEPVCDLYRTLLSIRDQIAPAAISCGKAGPTPSFTFPGGDEYPDDPCTFDVDEQGVPWPGPGDSPLSLCGPVTAESLALAEYDPDTLFAGYSVDAGTIVYTPPAPAALAFAAEPITEPVGEQAAGAERAEATAKPGEEPAEPVALEIVDAAEAIAEERVHEVSEVPSAEVDAPEASAPEASAPEASAPEASAPEAPLPVTPAPEDAPVAAAEDVPVLTAE